MSLFRSMMASMEHDLMGQHMQRMDQMMDNMMMPFESMFSPMGRPMSYPSIAPNQNSLMSFPGFGHSVFPSADQMFNNIQTMATNPNCHSYASSSVTTYTMDGSGRPQVYQATASTRSAPGGIKETRNSVRDSHTGQQQMSIGHHIHDKAHIVEKSRNTVTGQRDEAEEFINLEEEEADEFNMEWMSKTRKRSATQQPAIDDSSVEIIEIPSPLAIEAGSSQQPSHPHRHSRKRDKELGLDSSRSGHISKKSNHKKTSRPSSYPRHESHM